jgi:hypothetical protein
MLLLHFSPACIAERRTFFSVCDYISNHTIALLVVGHCRFLREFSSKMEQSAIPLPVILLDLDPHLPCQQVTLSNSVYSATPRHEWLPFVIDDSLAYLESRELVVVYSEACEKYFKLFSVFF